MKKLSEMLNSATDGLNLFLEEDLSSKTNGVGGKDAAPNKENEMDKREAIREIMAISAKPVSEFAGGEEEKVETIAGLAEKLAYKPSETSKADDACGKDAEVDKRKLIDEIGGILKDKVSEEIIRTIMGKAEEIAYNDSTAETADDEEETEEVKEEAEEKEDKKVASLDEMEKALLARLSRKAELVKQLTPIIGAFDSADMTEKEVAAYACKKLNLSAAMDEAPAVVKGYLAGRAKTDVRVTFGAKAKTAAQDEQILNNFKEGK